MTCAHAQIKYCKRLHFREQGFAGTNLGSTIYAFITMGCPDREMNFFAKLIQQTDAHCKAGPESPEAAAVNPSVRRLANISVGTCWKACQSQGLRHGLAPRAFRTVPTMKGQSTSPARLGQDHSELGTGGKARRFCVPRKTRDAFRPSSARKVAGRPRRARDFCFSFALLFALLWLLFCFAAPHYAARLAPLGSMNVFCDVRGTDRTRRERRLVRRATETRPQRPTHRNQADDNSGHRARPANKRSRAGSRRRHAERRPRLAQHSAGGQLHVRATSARPRGGP